MCGELRVQDEGKQVTLCGWVQPSRSALHFSPASLASLASTHLARLCVKQDCIHTWRVPVLTGVLNILTNEARGGTE